MIFNFKKLNKEQKDKGEKEEKFNSKLDRLNDVSEANAKNLSIIVDKLDNQNIRITKLEQTVENAKLAEIPWKLSQIEASVKSAHHRIDEIKK